jgi:hypothetical protein
MNTGFPAGQTSFGFPKTQNTPNTGYGSMPNFGAPNPPLEDSIVDQVKLFQHYRQDLRSPRRSVDGILCTTTYWAKG